MNFEDLYDYMGQMGLYQLCSTITLLFFCIFTVESITMNFVGAEMPHWCKVPELENISYERQRYIAIPWEDPSDPTSYDQCSMHVLDYTNMTYDDLVAWNRTTMLPNDTQTVSCNEWVYEQSTFVSTIVSRFGLVCETAYLNQLVTTIYMFGVMLGVLSSGAISDKVGRKATLMIFMLIRIVGYGIGFFAVHYVMLCIGRFIIGIGTSGCFLTAYVLLAELVGPRFRTACGVGVQMAFSVGFILQAPISYAVRHDIKYQVASHGGPALIFFTLALFLPESPRWLAVNEKNVRAQKVLDDICSGNGTSLPENFELSMLKKETSNVEKKNCTALLKSPKMRYMTIIMDFSWFTCSLVYYSLSLNTGTLSGDIFVNTMVSGLVEIPANIICIFLLDWKYLGRRGTLAGSFLLAGLSSFIGIPLTIYNYGSASTAMAMVGKAFVTITFSVVYVHASELFPTEIRHVGLGTASMFARVGSMIAPYMGAPLIDLWEPLPAIVFGSLATLSGILGLFLPETLGHPLLDTIEQAENYDWKKKPTKGGSDASSSDGDVVHSTPSIDGDGNHKDQPPPSYADLTTKEKSTEAEPGLAPLGGPSSSDYESIRAETKSIDSDICYKF